MPSYAEYRDSGAGVIARSLKEQGMSVRLGCHRQSGGNSDPVKVAVALLDAGIDLVVVNSNTCLWSLLPNIQALSMTYYPARACAARGTAIGFPVCCRCRCR